ncbi:MAG: hypothetical protein K0U84_18425 [Actinomycetia bacterium]|nr:hypothetical protein [Actinomycetes bacterium]
MTYPVGTTPSDAYDNTNFAAYAGTSAATWEATFTAGIDTYYGDAETGFGDVLADAGNGDTNATAALDLIDDVAKAIHNGYNGSGGTGTAAQVQAVIEDIVTRLEALEP